MPEEDEEVPSEEEQFKTLAARGKSKKEIATWLARDLDYVEAIAKRLGIGFVELNPSPKSPKKRAPSKYRELLTEREAKDFKKLMRWGYSINSISARLGISLKRTNRFYKEFLLEMGGKLNDKLETLYILYEEGLTHDQIKKKLSVGQSWISRHVKIGVEAGRIKSRRPLGGVITHKHADLIVEMRISGKSFGEISRFFTAPDAKTGACIDSTVTRNVVTGICARRLKKSVDIGPKKEIGIFDKPDRNLPKSMAHPIDRAADYTLPLSEMFAPGGPFLLEEMRFDQCKYPVGDSDPIRFCGRKRRDGSPYCGDHATITTDASPEARRFIYETCRAPIEKRVLWKHSGKRS